MRMNMEPNAQQPTQTTNKPVMDVVPPPKPAAALAVPSEGVKTPPPMPADATPAAETSGAKEQAKQAKPKVPKPPKTPRSGVGLAIAATVVIVLGLAALFVYAYLRTNNISIL